MTDERTYCNSCRGEVYYDPNVKSYCPGPPRCDYERDKCPHMGRYIHVGFDCGNFYNFYWAEQR